MPLPEPMHPEHLAALADRASEKIADAGNQQTLLHMSLIAAIYNVGASLTHELRALRETIRKSAP